MSKLFPRFTIFLCLIMVVSTVAAATPARPTVDRTGNELARMDVGNDAVRWTALSGFESISLVVSGPDGITSRTFAGGEAIVFDFADEFGNPFSDGAYSWELLATPKLSTKMRDQLEIARAEGNTEAIARLLPKNSVQSGTFTILNGAGVDPDVREGGLSTRDQVILDDLIVDGSACIGFDCVNGESFGFDTLRLKENNLRIKFQDTSASASFPSNDWQLTANDSANGGANKFSIVKVPD